MKSHCPACDPLGSGRREFLRRLAAVGAVTWAAPVVRRVSAATNESTEPTFASVRLSGWVQQYVSNVTEQWLKVAPASNPALLEMFRDRDRQPLRDMVSWAGEFAGKYLTSAVQVYRLTGDPGLRSVLDGFVREFISLQDANGYLGPWPRNSQLTGTAPNCSKGRPTWDTWGHYHAMLGLLLWYETAGDQAALVATQRMADLLCRTFDDKRMVDIGSTEMNLAPIHSLCLLQAKTPQARYLEQAKKIRAQFAATNPAGEPLAGDFVHGPLSGKEFYQLPKPRWEGLHSVMGLAELSRVAPDAEAAAAVEKIWWSIARWDRHNNGGFSSGEKACGDPYNKGAIETCCTIAWTALGIDVLRLTDNSVVADELELSTLNSILGLHSPNGRWVTYNTPMDGVRKASAHDIVFQSREGSPELNCCSVNGARGLGMIGDWAVFGSAKGVTVNWYGPSTLQAKLPAVGVVRFEQRADYPRTNRVRFAVTPERAALFAVRLRIPAWSLATRIAVNDVPIPEVVPGRYLTIERRWSPGDTIAIDLDFTLQYWVGERACAGLASVYRGPLLLTYDRRLNDMDPDEVPPLVARNLRYREIEHRGSMPPYLLLEFASARGRPLRLCDFASAGMGGSPYRTWLPVTGCQSVEFSPSNPRRSAPVT